MSSSSQASADAATLSAQSREIAARLIRWFLDDFTRTSIAPVVNQAMSVTSGDIRRLAYFNTAEARTAQRKSRPPSGPCHDSGLANALVMTNC